MKLTELDIQMRFFWERWPKTLLLPNYTPENWFECDVFEYTVGGFFREFEIKLNKYDLRADEEKRLLKTGTPKHDLLAKGDTNGPAEFHYLMPLELALECDVPDYAGIIGFEDNGLPGEHLSRRVRMEIVKRAKRLHNQRIPGKIIDHARNTCYYRMHRLMWRLLRERQKVAEERAEGDMAW